MDQPFINQNCQEGNQEQNEINIITTNVNNSPSQQSQDIVSPPTPAYDSLQNMDEIIDKPSIDYENQISINTQQPNNPPQDIAAPSIQNQTPSSYQVIANPVYSNYSSPYTAKYVVPLEFQSNYKYEHYKNISDLPNRGIDQINENTFHISIGCCFKIVPFIFFLAGLGTIVISFFVTDRIVVTIIISIFGLIFTSIGMLIFCKQYNDIYFIMGPNSLTIVEKALCGKQTTFYDAGELIRINVHYEYVYSSSGEGNGGYVHHYIIEIVPKNGKPNNILNISSSSIIYTKEEIGYFLYRLNTHIKNKMIV